MVVKNILKPEKLPLLTVALGSLGLVLRMLLYMVAVDAKNLVRMGHPPEILLWLVTIAAAVLIINAVRKGYSVNFGNARMGGLGTAVMAAGVVITVLEGGIAPTGLEKIRDLLGLLSGAGLAAAAVSRWQGKQPFFLLYGIICVFFAIHMVSCYQLWSSNPQIQDYVFTLAACIGLMLFSYQQAAFYAGIGKEKWLLAMGLVSVFSCLVCVSGTENPILYLTGGIWGVTNLCCPTTGE